MLNQERVEQLFAAAAKLPAEERSTYLDDSSASADENSAVSRLLEAHERDAHLLKNDIFTDVERIDAEFFTTISESQEFGLKAGMRIDGFEIIDELGRGGMSIVYRAEQHEPIHRQVALKIVNPSLVSPDAMQRFLCEQQALALVRHPHIATLYSAGQANGKPYAAMEFVDGTPIDEYCDSYALTVPQRIAVFRQVASALQHAHEHGVIHRDVKPDNIMVYREHANAVAKLIDFGVAKLLVETRQVSAAATRSGQLVGSPRYMSPEQITGAPVDARSDVYCAGLTLFELVTGTPVRQYDDLMAISQSLQESGRELASERLQKTIHLKHVAEHRSTTPYQLNRYLKRDLDWVIRKATSSDPAERYQSMSEMIEDLDRVLADQPAEAARPSRFRRAVASTQKALKEASPYLNGLVATLLFGVIIISMVILQDNRNTKAELRETRQQQVAAVADGQAAANDFVMRLLASDMYELSIEDYNTRLIPAYEEQTATIAKRGGPIKQEESAAYAILAVLKAMNGDFEAADRLFAEAVSGKNADLETLRNIRTKVVTKYKDMATVALENRGTTPIDQDTAIQMRTLGRCYLAEKQLEDAETWVRRSLDYFATVKTDSLEELETRSLLAQVLREKGEVAAAAAFQQNTVEHFSAIQRITKSPRGQQVLNRLQN